MDSRTLAAAESCAVVRPVLAAGLVVATVAGASALGPLPPDNAGLVLSGLPGCRALTIDAALQLMATLPFPPLAGSIRRSSGDSCDLIQMVHVKLERTQKANSFSRKKTGGLIQSCAAVQPADVRCGSS